MTPSTRIVRKNPDSVAAPVAAYSHITVVPPGSQFFVLSGQLGNEPDGSTPYDVHQQIQNAFDNCRKILASEGLQGDNMIKVNVWLTESIDRELYSELWEHFHGGSPPSATLAYVTALSRPECKVEIEVWAAK
ncbi:MAG: RidA family protein [Pseudomonadales bacterium]